MVKTVEQTLAQAFFAHPGKLIDKWEQYIGAYEAELGPLFRSARAVDLLEIGVQNGGSLELWAGLLPPGSTVTGLDIDPRVGALTFDHPAIRTHVLDAGDGAAVTAALGDATYDIVIDDGSHVCADVIANLRQFFPRLRPGGVLFVEDLHTSYSPMHGGAYGATDTSIEYLKHAIDLLHADHFAPEHGQALEMLLPSTMRETLASVTVYDSLVALRTLATRKERPWRRLISGDAAAVVPFDTWIGHAPTALLDNIAFGDMAARRFEAAYLRSCGDHLDNASLVADLRTELRNTKIALGELARDVAALQGDLVDGAPAAATMLPSRLASLRERLDGLSKNV